MNQESEAQLYPQNSNNNKRWLLKKRIFLHEHNKVLSDKSHSKNTDEDTRTNQENVRCIGYYSENIVDGENDIHEFYRNNRGPKNTDWTDCCFVK